MKQAIIFYFLFITVTAFGQRRLDGAIGGREDGSRQTSTQPDVEKAPIDFYQIISVENAARNAAGPPSYTFGAGQGEDGINYSTGSWR